MLNVLLMTSVLKLGLVVSDVYYSSYCFNLQKSIES